MDGAAPQDMLGDLAARLGGDPGAGVLLSVARHLHALVAELRPTPADLAQVIGFLTEVGHSADARRQEWVLLADVLGLSTLTEDLHGARPAGATPGTVAGPFYRADAPDLPSGADLSRDGRGEPLAVRGLVRGLDGRGVADALIEVWQANGEGFYENQQPDLQPEFNLRGRFRSDAAGRFAFRSVKPCGYALPEDGPVGRLMNGLGYRLERPAHLHARITAPGFRGLTTHVFDRADPAIGRDALFGVKPALLADFVAAPGGWTLDVTFTLAPETAQQQPPH